MRPLQPGRNDRALSAAPYPRPVSPSGRFPNETFGQMLKRQRLDPHSPGARLVPENMVFRDKHPLNKGKPSQYHIGRPNKRYCKHDILGPILDSMNLMYYRLGWAAAPWFTDDDDTAAQPSSSANLPNLPNLTNLTSHMHAFGYGPPPPDAPLPPLCAFCGTTNPHDFMPTSDKSHMVCKCGLVSSAIHISTDREKNCAKDEDKTTHADKPYEARTDRFDEPAKSCEELRKERERDAAGTRISKKTKEKLGLGWQHEHMARAAASADRQRHEMSIKDQNKGQHIVMEIEKLFTPLEPVASQIKRFCRMEADRAWREAVRHSKICQAKNMCQLRIKEKGPAVIADAALSCSINALVEGRATLDGISHASVLVLADKLGAMQAAKGSCCALRAVRTIVSTLLLHNNTDPIQTCPVAACQQPSPVPSSSSEKSSLRYGNTSFVRNNSSLSDLAEGGEVMQLRDSISKIFKVLNTAMTNRVRDGALVAIQEPSFRAALAAAREESSSSPIRLLTSDGLSYGILEAVAQQVEAAGSSPGARPRLPNHLLSTFCHHAETLAASIAALRDLLPDCAASTPGPDGDGLFG